MGLLLRLIYLGTGRNLAVPIVAHGVADSIEFVPYHDLSAGLLGTNFKPSAWRIRWI
jgi:membrane protease YdiL (CAAX protease family)